MGAILAVVGPARAGQRTSMLEDRWLIGGLIMAVLAVYVVADLGHTYDDPYILERYAQNLLDGHGWTLNPGESMPSAATSAGYVLMLAALGAVGTTIPAAATVWFVIGLGTAAWFTFLSHRRHGGALAAALVLLSPQVVSFRGMGTPVALGLVAVAVWACRERRDILAGVLVVTLFTVRPDGALLAPVLIGWRRVADGVWPWRLTAVMATGGLGATLALLGTVGIPATLAAKQAQAAAPW